MPVSNHSRLIVSTVGTSLLTNAANDNAPDRKRLNDLSNAKVLTGEDEELVVRYVDRAAATLATDNLADVRRASAELNGLLTLAREESSTNTLDQHMLITTDTALGRRCAELIAEYMQAHEMSVVGTLVPGELTTATRAGYQEGIRNLVKQCEETFPGYQQAGYALVFNLVGGFKSLQGYMTTLGMIYGAESVYLFEGKGAELLHIPPLPIVVDDQVLIQHAVPLAMMVDGREMIPAELVAGISQVLVEADAESACASAWGEVLWGRIRQKIYRESLLDFPRLQYAKSFERDFQAATPEQRIELQTKLARVSALLLAHDGDRAPLRADGGLLYETYRDRPSDGSQIDHFRISQGDRVSCIWREGELHLRHFGARNQVNGNP